LFSYRRLTVCRGRSTYLAVLFKRRPEHVERDGYQPGVLSLDVHEIGRHADPDHGALIPRLWRFPEKPGLAHVIGASVLRGRRWPPWSVVRRHGEQAKRKKLYSGYEPLPWRAHHREGARPTDLLKRPNKNESRSTADRERDNGVPMKAS